MRACSSSRETPRFGTRVYNVRAEQISREPGVRYLLEGSVRRAGDTVRINAQLIGGTSGEHLWAEIYDGDLADIFALQDNITSRIVATLAGELKSGYQAVAHHSETDSTEAYDDFLKGWEYYQNDNKKDLIKALPYLTDRYLSYCLHRAISSWLGGVLKLTGLWVTAWKE